MSDPLGGSFLNLIGSAAGTTKTAAWTCGEIIAETALGGTTYKGASLSFSFNGAVTGAGGMDTGATPTSGNLYVYAIYNPTTPAWSVLGTTAGAGATIYGGTHLPSGYTASCLIWSGVTDGSARVRKFNQQGNLIFFPNVNVLSLPAGSVPSTYTSASLAAIVPANAKTFSGTAGSAVPSPSAGGGGTTCAIACDSSGTKEIIVLVVAGIVTYDNFSGAIPVVGQPIVTSQTFYYKAYDTNQELRVDVDAYTF